MLFRSVGKLDSRTGMSRSGGSLTCGGNGPTVAEVDACLLEKKRYLVDLAVVAVARCHIVESREVAAYNLVVGGTAAHLIVADAEAL